MKDKNPSVRQAVGACTPSIGPRLQSVFPFRPPPFVSLVSPILFPFPLFIRRVHRHSHTKFRTYGIYVLFFGHPVLFSGT